MLSMIPAGMRWGLSVAAFGIGQIAVGFYADIVAIEGEPLKNIEDVIKGVRWVMKDGKVVVNKR